MPAVAGGIPTAADTAKAATRVGDVPLVVLAAPFASMDELKAYAKDVRGALGSGIIALVLDDDAPQVWVTVSDDLVARGLSAADLVARGDGSASRDGVADDRGWRRAKASDRTGHRGALDAIRAHVAR